MALNTEMFEFLRDNLRLEITDNGGYDYGRRYREVGIKLVLIDPSSGKDEVISSDTISLE